MITIDLLSLFPGYFTSPFEQSIIKRALERGIVAIRQVDIRDFSENRHKQVDDRPYGGGPGMVLMAPPVAKAIRSVKRPGSHVVYLSPQGAPFRANKAKELATKEHLVFLCGHYEGVDQRVIDSEVNEEISIGDYVLTNGCIAAIVVIDALLRFVPGVLGHESAAEEDSFSEGLFDWPQYTRPELFEGVAVPEVLRGGNHKEILEWRREQAKRKTRAVRPELFGE